MNPACGWCGCRVELREGVAVCCSPACKHYDEPVPTALTIGDTNRDGLAQIVDVSQGSTYGMRDDIRLVTVREMIGEREPLSDNTIAAMRRLARKAHPEPDTIRSAKVHRYFYAEGSTHATFCLSPRR